MKLKAIKLWNAFFVIICIFLLTACQKSKVESAQQGSNFNNYDYVSSKYLQPSKAGVASAHPLASEVGLRVLKEGGNAIDANIAMQWALAVVYPEAGNIGGGGFTVIHLANGENTTMNYREKAPGSAHKNMFLNENGEVISRASRDGGLAVGVPGTVAGIFAIHDRYGSLPMKDLIQPAIEIAKSGYSITEKAAAVLNVHQRLLKKYNPEGNAFIRDRKWKKGDTLIQKDLAHTLELIRDEGKMGFYDGETAQRIVEEMEAHSGLISLKDLKNYEAEERAPLDFNYKGYRVITMPPPSSGGVALQQMLGMIENYPIEEYGFGSIEAVQLMIEIERRAFADRASYLGDPNFVDVPLESLSDNSYLENRMKDYDPEGPTPSDEIGAGILIKESKETTHLVVLDSIGNAVSTTYTLNGNFGSHVVVHGAGFVLNNEMDDFSAKKGAPNKNGLILKTDANAIEPNKRMLSSMTPTIVLKNGSPFLILGSIGSATIITSVFQSIVNIIDFKLSLQEAVNKPKFHMQWMPDVVEIEKGFPDSLTSKLKEMGYNIKIKRSIGRTEIIKQENDSIEIVADRRGDDSAAGY